VSFGDSRKKIVGFYLKERRREVGRERLRYSCKYWIRRGIEVAVSTYDESKYKVSYYSMQYSYMLHSGLKGREGE
jgi:hypothetical protein